MPSLQRHRDPQRVPARVNRPWTIAAVCVMGVGVQLMVVGLSQVPAAELAPAYAAVYLLVGLCIFAPSGMYPSLGQAAAFIVPGILLVGLWALQGGFWCGTVAARPASLGRAVSPGEKLDTPAKDDGVVVVPAAPGRGVCDLCCDQLLLQPRGFPDAFGPAGPAGQP